jgi:hypothetical protein
MAAISLSLVHGTQGVKYSDFTQGTLAPNAGDVEVRWNSTDSGAGNKVTREDTVLMLRAILRLLEEGNVAAASGFTPPPLQTANI